MIRGSTTIVEILRSFPDGEAAELMRRLYWPCAHCGGALREPLTMAADIGMEATTSLEGAFAAAMERKGPDAKVIVLPFARYQLPRNAIRMHASDAIPRGAVPA